MYLATSSCYHWFEDCSLAELPDCLLLSLPQEHTCCCPSSVLPSHQPQLHCVLSPKILLWHLKLRMLSLEILFNNQFVYTILWISLCQDTKAIQNVKFPEEEGIQNENEFSSSWIPQRWSLFWHDLLLVSILLQNVSVTAAPLLQTFSTLLLIYDIGMIYLHNFGPSQSSAIFS